VVQNELKGEEVLHALFELTREFLVDHEERFSCVMTKCPSFENLTNAEECKGQDESTPTPMSSPSVPSSKGLSSSTSTSSDIDSHEVTGASGDDNVAFRAVTLDFLIKFTCEHDLWHTPTHQVVTDIIIPTMTEHGGGPYTSILSPEDVGQATIFISHAWANSFGLAVAAVRKYVGDQYARQHQYSKKHKHKGGDEETPVFIWMDVFAVTQQQGEDQIHDLSQLEPTIADENCRTLVVLDEEGGIPLKRCWCIFEIYATLYHCDLKYSGKLQVRAGRVVGRYGEFQPCSNRDRLVELASNVDASSALCSVESDKEMILKQIQKLGGADRNGVHELNRILQRAVRHGWT
jgi:hypothetical protein